MGERSCVDLAVRVQPIAPTRPLDRPLRRSILCVHPRAAGLCGLIRAYARPGTTVEGVVDLAVAADMIRTAPEGFELVVLGEAIDRHAASQFVERIRAAGYRHHIARPTAAELASGLLPSRPLRLTGSALESFSTNTTV